MRTPDPYGFDTRDRGNIFRHAGFRVGFIGALVMVCVHIILLLIFQGTNHGDVLGWMIGWFVYFFVGRAAAQADYNEHRDQLEATKGLAGAGLGAALVTSIIVWIFIILRGIFRDAIGITVIVEPIGLCVAIVVDVLAAMGLGSLGAKTIANKYKTFTGW